ncbi:phage tail protein [bacterium]|nr:phage tail protein [candidate division CSSED10-310 bacterium]
MAPGDRNDPYMSYRFLIIIDQIIEGGFSEVSGLDITTQVEEYWEGGENSFVHKLPKETRFANLIMKKGLADKSRLWEWHFEVVSGLIIRRGVHIVLLKDRESAPLQMWSFKDAYPVKWTGPELKADANTVAFQTLELAHHGYLGSGVMNH